MTTLFLHVHVLFINERDYCSINGQFVKKIKKSNIKDSHGCEMKIGAISEKPY
jgi:hypothetical protein